MYRWVQRFTPLLSDAARPCRHVVGDRWYVDETYVKVAGRWRYVYPAIDQYGQIIDVYVSARRDIRAAPRFFAAALGAIPPGDVRLPPKSGVSVRPLADDEVALCRAAALQSLGETRAGAGPFAGTTTTGCPIISAPAS